MGILKGKPDAGQGGKRGHSNMDHWEFTEEIKEAARKRRRLEAKKETATAWAETDNDGGVFETSRDLDEDLDHSTKIKIQSSKRS